MSDCAVHSLLVEQGPECVAAGSLGPGITRAAANERCASLRVSRKDSECACRARIGAGLKGSKRFGGLLARAAGPASSSHRADVDHEPITHVAVQHALVGVVD